MWLNAASVRRFFWTHFSRPAAIRPIYRLIGRHRPRRIVELGIGLADRSRRMIEMAAAYGGAENVVYSGIDLFELRTEADGPGLSLKNAHRKLVTTGAKIRLLPGDPHAALARSVNMLGVADLVIIAADQDRTALQRSWYYLERLLQEKTVVMLQDQPAVGAGHCGVFRTMAHGEIRRLATARPQRRRAA